MNKTSWKTWCCRAFVGSVGESGSTPDSSEVDGKRLDSLIEAPKDLLTAFRNIAVQGAGAFVVVIGWLLSQEPTQELIGSSRRFALVCGVGTLIVCLFIHLLLASYRARSETAFSRLDKNDKRLLECYSIKFGQFLITVILFWLLGAYACFHIMHIHKMKQRPADAAATQQNTKQRTRGPLSTSELGPELPTEGVPLASCLRG